MDAANSRGEAVAARAETEAVQRKERRERFFMTGLIVADRVEGTPVKKTEYDLIHGTP
jgi:hypothetical protein